MAETNPLYFAPQNHQVHQTDLSKFGQYSNQAAANPYAEPYYRKSFWQSWLEGLGFRTDYDRYMESMALNAKEYEAQLLDKQHNEEYDSASAQAQRMRQAGLNPDLQDVGAGESSGMSPDPSLPAVPENNDFERISSFASMVMDAVSMAQSLASTGVQFSSMFADLKGKKIDNDNKLLSTAYDALLGLTSPEDMDNFMNSDMSVQANNYLPGLTEVFGSRRAKKYVGAVNRLAQGLTGHDLEMKLRGSLADSWTEYFRKTAGGDEAGFSMFKDTMKILNEELSKNLWKNLTASTKLESSEIADKQMYEDKRLEGSLPESQAQNEQALLGWQVDDTYWSAMQKKQSHTLMKSFESIQSKLSAEADKGNWFASLVSLGLTWLMSRFSGGFGVKL